MRNVVLNYILNAKTLEDMHNGFIIHLGSLPAGLTESCCSTGKEFFGSFGNTEIIDASLEVKTVVEKSGQYTGIDCIVKGMVTVPCDRCLGNLEISVDTTIMLSIKYGDGSPEDRNEGEREIICLPEKDADFDMSQIIYDYACLSLPMHRVHPEGECDQDVVARLGVQPAMQNDTDENSSPFAALKSILKN